MAKRPAKRDSSHPCSPANPVSPTEGTPAAAKRQQQDGLIQEQEELTSDKPPTVIPFPSEEAQAAGSQPDHQEAGGTHEGGGKPGARQTSWTAKTLRDWSQFTRVREKHTFEERIERKKRKYRKKLRRAKLASPNAKPSTIIPFPSEQAEAAGKPAAPSSDA